jgi:tyrosyl-tRNA synthetase
MSDGKQEKPSVVAASEGGDKADAQGRLDVILRDLAEYVGEDEISGILQRGAHPRVYWGTATTGKPHFGYFLPMMKISDFLDAGCEVTILFADLHACLDHEKTDWDEVNARCAWYKFIITEMLKVVGVPLDKLKFVTGTDYQFSREYTFDVYRLSTMSTVERCGHAGAEVVKSSGNPLLSGLLYPILQALDEQYLDVDVQFGGVDQRKIFMFAREGLPKLGYRKRSHLMNPLIPSLSKSGKMSASDKSSRLDFDDTPKQIRAKINAAFSVDGEVENNGLLALLKFIIFRWLERKSDSGVAEFKVNRPEKWGGPVSFSSYADVEGAFAAKELLSGDLKIGVADALVEFLAPLRTAIGDHKDLLVAAYPDDDPVAAAQARKRAQREANRAQSQAQAKNAPATLAFGALQCVVGEVKSVKVHPNADKLYVEEIDVGEGEPRTIVSGLVPYMTAEELLGKRLLVCLNLNAAELKGVKSFGMVLAAKQGDPRDQASMKVELVAPPAGAKVGERVLAAGEPGQEPDSPAISKARLGKLLKLLATDEEGVVCCKKLPLEVGGGKCTSSLKNAAVN